MKYLVIQIGIAAYSGEPNKDLVEASNRFIEELAKYYRSRNVVLVMGGYWGLMKHISDKACSEGFKVVFILPEKPRELPPDDSCYIAINTGLDFRQRSEIIVLSSKALAVMGGSVGTIIEILMSAAAGKPLYILSGYDLPSDRVSSVLEGLAGYLDFKYRIYHRDPINMARDLYRELQ